MEISNASGINCTTKEELDELLESEYITRVVTKSCTRKARKGNEEPRYYYNAKERISINSTGLANEGFEYYLEYVKNNCTKKPMVISIAETEKNEIMGMLVKITEDETFNKERINIEINLSCPNILQKGLDFKELKKRIPKISKLLKEYNWGIKLPPFFNNFDFEKIARILNRSTIKFIVSINSIGGGLILNKEFQPVIFNEYGGIGGPVIKSIGLSNVRRFRGLLKSDIKIIGCGGIETERDIQEYKSVGASSVQIGTMLRENGIKNLENFFYKRN